MPDRKKPRIMIRADAPITLASKLLQRKLRAEVAGIRLEELMGKQTHKVKKSKPAQATERAKRITGRK